MRNPEIMYDDPLHEPADSMRESSFSPEVEARMVQILEEELQISVGCTDPAAVGLAAAAAAAVYAERIFGKNAPIEDILASVASVSIDLDLNLYKNAAAVFIPGTRKKGVKKAAVLGLLIQNTEDGLRLFNNLPGGAVSRAERLEKEIPVTIQVREDFSSLSIDAEIQWRDGNRSAASIREHHDLITRVSLNDELVVSRDLSTGSVPADVPELPLHSLAWLAEQVPKTAPKKLQAVIEGLNMNFSAAQSGMAKENLTEDARTYAAFYSRDREIDRVLPFPYELEACFSESTPVKSIFDIEAVQNAKITVAAATRLRMSGKDVPIMACGGSGNHGITFFLTLMHGWRMRGIRPERSFRHAGLLGILLLHQIKRQTGVITPMCGCAVASGLAASAALAWGLGAGPDTMLQAMNIVLSSLGGVVCDGAKPSCALKTSLSAQVTLEAARMAVNGLTVPSDEGLGAGSFSELLEILRRIHLEGMALFDRTMVSIIRNRELVQSGSAG